MGEYRILIKCHSKPNLSPDDKIGGGVVVAVENVTPEYVSASYLYEQFKHSMSRQTLVNRLADLRTGGGLYPYNAACELLINGCR